MHATSGRGGDNGPEIPVQKRLVRRGSPVLTIAMHFSLTAICGSRPQRFLTDAKFTIVGLIRR